MHLHNEGRGRTTDATTDAVAASGVVAVLRARSPEYFLSTTEVLVDAGIAAIEVTLTTPQPSVSSRR